MDEEQRVRLEELLRLRPDWEILYRTAGAHGLLPLLHLHLTAAGIDGAEDPVVSRIHEYYRANAGRALQLTATLLGVLSILDDAGIVAVPYKGPVLAAELYGNVANRQAGDLDILVRKEDVTRAVSLLGGIGFRHRYPTTPAIQSFRLASRYSEELVGPHDIDLELHWAFANRDVPFPLAFEDLAPRLAEVRIGPAVLPSFRPDDLLLILCVHGAKHRWDRLEWIVGIAELLRQQPPSDWLGLIGRAERLQASRTLLLGLYLAHDIFGAPVPADVLRSIRNERWILTLAADVRNRTLCDPRDEKGVRGGVLSRNLFQFPLQQSTAAKLRYLLYRLTTPNRPDSWTTVTVGGRWLPLHALTWPLRLGAKLATMPFRYGIKRK
jgi:hypothetical protein